MIRAYSVLLTSRIVKFSTKFSDQRERVLAWVRQYRFGWRPCRPVSGQIGLVCVLLLVLAAAGCGGGAEGRVSVSGQVTVDGQPLETGSLTLIPIEGTKGPTAGAEIERGSYTILAAKGPMAGKYRVRIIAMRKTGRKIKDEFANSPEQMIDEVEQFVPVRYNRQSELTVELHPDANRGVNFDLRLKD